MDAAATAHSENSVRYSVSVMPGQRLPGSMVLQPAPPVIRKSGSFQRYLLNNNRPQQSFQPRFVTLTET